MLSFQFLFQSLVLPFVLFSLLFFRTQLLLDPHEHILLQSEFLLHRIVRVSHFVSKMSCSFLESFEIFEQLLDLMLLFLVLSYEIVNSSVESCVLFFTQGVYSLLDQFFIFDCFDIVFHVLSHSFYIMHGWLLLQFLS